MLATTEALDTALPRVWKALMVVSAVSARYLQQVMYAHACGGQAFGKSQFKPVKRRLDTLGIPAYFPSRYRAPEATSKAAVSFWNTRGGVMFCQRANDPAGVYRLARAFAVVLKS
jgi:hypothetical protein